MFICPSDIVARRFGIEFTGICSWISSLVLFFFLIKKGCSHFLHAAKSENNINNHNNHRPKRTRGNLQLQCCGYHKTSNISCTFVCNRIVDHSDIVGASPVDAAPTTSSYLSEHLATMDWAKTTTRRDEKHLSFEIWCDSYKRFYGKSKFMACPSDHTWLKTGSPELFPCHSTYF